jgi:hypothetical protein
LIRVVPTLRTDFIVKAGHHFGDTPDEALALLGIWLRDKKLMEWIYKEGEK